MLMADGTHADLNHDNTQTEYCQGECPMSCAQYCLTFAQPRAHWLPAGVFAQGFAQGFAMLMEMLWVAPRCMDTQC
jgi:hypothetical protein